MIAITIGARIALSAREVPAKRSRSFGAPADAATIMRDASPDASPKTGNYPYRRLKPRVMTLRQRARKAEEIIARLTREREALDRALAQPNGAGGNGFAPSEALKRRAELVRMIERAEVDWLAAEQAIERESNA